MLITPDILSLNDKETLLFDSFERGHAMCLVSMEDLSAAFYLEGAKTLWTVRQIATGDAMACRPMALDIGTLYGG